jgi:hypothetical protein
MKVTGFRCDLCGNNFVAGQFLIVPQPHRFSAKTEIPAQAGYSWEYSEICEACELEIRKAINTVIVGLNIKEDQE